MSAPSNSSVLQHLAYNVFLPPKLPQEEQKASFQQSVDLAIVGGVIQAGHFYQSQARIASQWAHIKLMLERLSSYIKVPLEKSSLREDMKNMKSGDILTLYIRAQNTGVIIRKQSLHTTFEAFEIQPQTEDVMSITGKVVRHFPGPAVELHNLVANDHDFIAEVANILVQMDTELFADAQPTTRKAGTNVRESRNSINPNYFIQYFFGFLRGMGTTINPPRVVKRLADEVLWMNAKNPWRRSPIWLLIRVALQTSFDSTTTYKHFMVCYHAYVLSRCAKWGTFSSDLLHAMRVKMARRLHKIKDSAPQFLIDFAEDAANRIQNILQGRWDAIQSAQSQSQSPNQNFSGSNFQSAVNLTLPNSRQYLERVFQYQYAHKNPAKFSPSHPSRSDNIREFSHYANGGLSRAFTNDPHLALFDFEASVFEKLVEWTSNQQNFSAACVIMSSCFRQYLNSAKSYYIADAADQSIMILTLMRIWMAIDELAIKDCPLLSRFSPELPADILDPLLLRTTQHLEAACTIQQHIRQRYSNATQGNPSVLSEKAAQNCFAVQYFRSSSRHQQRKAKIEAYAQEQQNRKIKELEDLNAKHEKLGREIDALSHEYRFTPKGKRKHVRGCSRCTLEKTRSSLHIRPYEWPLPPGQLDAEMVVFELDRPESFIVWRDITYEILMDLGTLSPRAKSDKYTILDGYSALGSWRLIPSSTTPRITIASSTKSFGQSHYNSTVSIPASSYQVCLDNALQFKLYDKNGDAWASGPFPSVTFSQYGTLKLPANSLYRHLGYAIEGTTHTSNQVLANQHDCPKELSLHEHIAFGTLRSGARLQWMNIVRGLEEDLLTFSADEVRLLHTQAAWQVGPLMDNGTREWHEELNSLEFGRLLVLQCRRVLDRVKANWLQAASVSTIVMLVTRLLASSPTHNTTQLALDFLRSARAVTHKWLDQLKFKLKSATGEQDVVDYQRRVCEMAAICRATYDIRTLENLKHDSFLVDIHSTEFQSLARSLSPLESDQYLHATRSVLGLVEIELPRMKLSFFINQDSQLESRNFRDQVLDEDQSAGTLFGLKNQLLLRAKGTVAQSLPRSRTILIPDGEIHFSLQGHHVSVSIQFDSRRSVDVYRYKIDRDLGYLATDAGLTSRLFKIYLHALTSHCLPDPLTGLTGTEEALQELSQGSSSSFEQIDVRQAGLLKAIGLLTPKREYYPKHLKSMQTTQWIKLPSLSQHYRFSFAAASILRRADMLQLFYPLDFKIDDYVNALENSDLLLKRATRRTAIYYPSDTAGSISDILGSETGLDSVCPGRDNLSGDWIQAGQAARWASGLAYQNYGKPVFVPYQLASLAHSWGTLNDSEVHYPLTYQSSWFSLNLRSCWITFYNLLRRARVSDNKYMLSACLSSIAFGQGLPTDLIPVFLAFATNPDFHILNPPSHKHYTFGDGYEPSRKRVEGFVSSAAFSSDLSPARNLSQEEDESNPNFYGRKQAYHRTHSSSHQSQLVQHLMNQWSNVREGSSVQLRSPGSTYAQWIKVESCLKSTREYFTSCMWNLKMKNHLLQLESVLSSGATSPGTIFSSTYEKLIDPPVASSRLANPWRELSISTIMGSRLAPTLSDIVTLYRFSIPSAKGPANDTARLAKLFTELQENESALNRRYGIDLDASRRELDSKPSLPLPGQVPQPLVFNQNRERCSTCHLKAFQRLESALSPSTNIERILSLSGIWPRITSRTLLQQLSLQNRRHRNLRGWWKGLTGYAHVFAGYQRSHRLIALADSGSVEELYKEMDVPGNNDPGINDPDWLLVQIDGNFSARTIQRQVAQEMISPSSGSNIVLQLNMGEGKSSVIVPIVASSLANSSRLVRVVVLKPLWRQMFELLVNRLSGLSNRRVYYLPFGRHINIDSANAIKLRNLYEECMREGGILLAQPEHILSFKLMGIDRLISSNEPGDIVVAKSLRNMQSWLNTHSRDILDESDEILHVRYQLVYTAGQQQPLDDHPDRWTTTQQFLRLTATHVKILQQEYPDSVSYKKKDGGQFPSLRIMPDCSTEVEKKLISAIAADVQNGRLPNLNCDSIHPSSRNVLLDFLVNDHLPYHQYELLRNNCDSAIWKGLLLIRGLLASGILVFTLKRKHYRVDYGLDLSRTLLAVPYRAKDLPSLRAEFGHPDVAVVLTCFSYYYQGLTEQQLNLCFELLLKLDNPPLEYEQWVQRDDTMPEDLRQLNSVNIKDRQQFTERLVPTFSHNSGTIDFFLFSVVFPKEAKEFPKKLATSGWDLAEGKADVTTGFSGTNDNRYLLPTSIKQADPVKQLSTNALVLTYLLQPENNTYVAMCDDSGESLTTEGFLKLLVAQTPEVRVLLDVGAQMLELQNEALVRRWLCLRPDIEAAVYFNDRDELVVLPQNGTPALLSTSPFSQRLDKCIVYLDDGHTRGTDLKLPRETRALVTLGPKVTKDRLLQGCMRMRKLGHGQSVMFAAPPEIDTQIRNASPDLVQRNNSITPGVGETQKYSTFLKNFWLLGGLLTLAGQNAQTTHRIDALDVLRWTMLQTCKDLQHHVSHWAQQGIEHAQRHEAERTYERTHSVSGLQEGWISPESRSLEEMYGVLSPEVSRVRSSFTQRAFDVPALRQGLDTLGVKKLEDPQMDEEQEREVNHEIEREQQTQRPPKGKPVNHSIHPDVKCFISTGTFSTSQSALLPLFHPFRDFNSQISDGWSRLLYCSVDFLHTVAGSPTDRLSEYMRPVNWIVSGHGDIQVVLSPHEVNELLPLIRNSSVVRLHIYAPRVSLSMLSFSDLRFYSIPAPPTSLIRPGALPTAQLQLDLFAGQLYLSSYQDYIALCAALGLYVGSSAEDHGVEIGTDGFVKPQHRYKLARHHAGYPECEFVASPIPALRDLVSRRRKGMKYLLTHVGQILHGRTLIPDDF
ncbi:unnamed protein product [Rhizoctonia solani]|uniref:ubiquitinyl hydrolase 1 n=1 Tax=Rhizoctonia solani TaxID=456999 RepID=A0A8H3BN32_9AGAM|nr:unnamed protein product [Rhizoctonia solani]